MSELYLSPGRATRIKPDFTHRPVIIELPRDNRPAIAIMAIVCVWAALGIAGTFYLLAGWYEGVGGAAVLAPVAVGLISTVLMVYLGWRALKLYVEPDRITITADDTVHVVNRHLFRTQSWQAPLAAFEGLRQRAIAADRGTPPHSIVELVHPPPNRTLPVYVDRVEHLPPHLVDDIAKRLALKRLDDSSSD